MPTDRLDEATVAHVVKRAGRSAAYAMTRDWARPTDVEFSQILVDDISSLVRIVHERVPHFLVRQLVIFYLFGGVALGAMLSSLVWWLVVV